MFFYSMVLASWKSCSYNLNLPTYQLTNFQIIVEDAPHASLCMEEHTWEITKSGEFYKYLDYCPISFNLHMGVTCDWLYEILVSISG